jgi:two-component sensor histidine kinase
MHGISGALPDVYITEELSKRPPSRFDPLAEKQALQDLAGRMLGGASEVLPEFVSLAMCLADGDAAGLSLYEPGTPHGKFRWHHLRGTLAAFEGATTPREASPCGVTLDANGPVLSSHPERAYGWIADANIIVPEVLLVPLYVGDNDPIGTLWVVSDTPGHFNGGHARMLTELATFVGIALKIAESERRSQRMLEAQQMVAREMSHRIKNFFALAEGMVRLTSKGARTKEDMVEALSGRLGALAQAHALVRPDFDATEGAARSSDLETLVRVIVEPHDGSRFSFDGPAIVCGHRAINGLAIVMHELATNAAKYGALAVDDGHVSIAWEQRHNRLVLSWSEEHGGTVTPPSSPGFGSQLMRAMVEQQFRGSINYDWRPDGVMVALNLDIAEVRGAPPEAWA